MARMEMRKLAPLTAAVSFVITASAQAAVPHTFEAGQPALASEVNANFADLDQRLAALPSAHQYDLSGGGSSVTQKTYSRTVIRRNSNQTAENDAWYVKDSCDRMAFVKTSATVHTITVTDSTSGEVCWEDKDLYEERSDGLYYRGWEYYSFNDAGEKVKGSAGFYETPIKNAPGIIYGSQPWDFSGVMVKTVYDYATGDERQSWEEVRINKSQIIGVEDVTVPAGTFKDCLKIHQDKAAPGRRQVLIKWSCSGVGTVKQLRSFVYDSSDQQRSEIRELLSYQ